LQSKIYHALDLSPRCSTPTEKNRREACSKIQIGFPYIQLGNNVAGDVIQVPLLQRKSSWIEVVLESLSVFPDRQCSYFINTMVSFV
jgi:hypothetical protein